MLTFCRKILIAVAALLITACSNTPPSIDPSVSLIAQDKVENYLAISNEIKNALAKGQTKLTSSTGKTLTISNHYFSALGYNCAQIKEKITSNQTHSYRVCQIEGLWQKLPSTELQQQANS